MPAYLALLAQVGVRPSGYSGSSRTPTSGRAGDDRAAAIAARIAMMDRAGVSKQILLASLASYLAAETKAVPPARLLNERLVELAAATPHPLAALACLPLPHVDAARAELRHGMDQLGLVGITMQTSCFGISIADEKFAPLFAEMNRRRATLFIHPAINRLRSPFATDWRIDTTLGPLLEDITIAVQLIAANIPMRYPAVRIVIPHLGSGFATMLDRRDNRLPLAILKLAGRPCEMARRFWYDSVAHGSLTGFDTAIAAFGADRIVPGSDFPVLLSSESNDRTINYVRKAGHAGAARQILHHSARALFAGALA